MVGLIIFDDGLGELGPMTDLRASFEVRSGMLTTGARLAACRPERLAAYSVAPRLAAVAAERADAPVNALPDGEAFLCANGRWALPDPALRLGPGEALRETATGHVVAAMLDRAGAEAFLAGGALADGVRCRELAEGALYRYPWQVIERLPKALALDLRSTRPGDAGRPGGGVAVVGDHPVEIHGTARVWPGVVLDAEGGPIRVHARAVIRPGAVVCGPASIGSDSIVVDRALIKANTAIGPLCKVGGEVGATVFQGLSNKAHDGHLGDSWVGEWVNIGAGTTASNLLNTYGEVTMRIEPEGPLHRTGMRFLGAVLGDHVKLAIETRLSTGTLVGTGAMVAVSRTVPSLVRRFAWLTDRGEQVFRFQKFLETARAMMARRNRSPGDAVVEALRALHERSRCDGRPSGSVCG